VSVSVDVVADFVRIYYDDMVREKALKRTWWLCFFMRRRIPKGELGQTCMYYLFLIQVPTGRLTTHTGDRDEIETEAKLLVNDVVNRVASEDEDIDAEIVDGFLVPVHNVWIVDRLRERKGQLQQEVAEKEAALTEKEAALAEKDAALTEKDKIIAKNDETIAEQAETIAEKDKEIELLKKQLGLNE